MPLRPLNFILWITALLAWLLLPGGAKKRKQSRTGEGQHREQIRAALDIPPPEERPLLPANRRRKRGWRTNLVKLILCLAAALLAWVFLPGTAIDRGFFALTSRSVAKPPFLIAGNGSHHSPHTLGAYSHQAAPPADPLPDIAITDDPDRIFQNSPPSPVDFAIILKNLRRLGRGTVAIGMPLAWPEPDVISLTALDQQLDELSSVVTAAPLSRGAVPSPLPPAFRRASLPVSEIRGNTRNLPVVNRVAIPDVVLGNTSSLAGFTVLESEPDGEPSHLLARWDDRVVLSFHLLAALADLGIPPSQLGIHVGNFISFGKDGPHIPIDDYGRLAVEPSPWEAPASIPAEKLIDAPGDFLSTRRAGTVLVRNGMSAADDVSLRFSEALVPTFSYLTAPSDKTAARPFPRIPALAELLLMASLMSLILGLGNYPASSGRFALAGLAGCLLILHFTLFITTGTWLPTLPALAAVWVAALFPAERQPVPVPWEPSPPMPSTIRL
jgi:hypothetical protein